MHNPLRARDALAAYRERQAAELRGHRFPDPRTDELRDRGVELQWRAAVLRNRIRRGRG